MVIVTEKQFYMDGYLKNALDTAKKEIKNDWDFVFVYDGIEGSGKSVKAMQDAFYCDPSLSFDRYAFNDVEFKSAINKAEKYQAVVYDEAHSGLNSRAAMSSVNRSIVSMLTEIRQKNLFVFVILPTFFDLDRYVAIWRSRLLCHIYTKESFNRGYFAFYNIDKKKMLYIKGKKFYQYNAVKPNFVGRFTNFYPLDQAEYRKRKYNATMEHKSTTEDEEILKIVNQMIYNKVMKAENLTHNQKMAILEMPSTTYYRKLKQFGVIGSDSLRE